MTESWFQGFYHFDLKVFHDPRVETSNDNIVIVDYPLAWDLKQLMLYDQAIDLLAALAEVLAEIERVREKPAPYGRLSILKSVAKHIDEAFYWLSTYCIQENNAARMEENGILNIEGANMDTPMPQSGQTLDGDDSSRLIFPHDSVHWAGVS